jgi:hypothetical protein
MPGGIISRLRHLNIIDISPKVRGYLEYEQSDLYKEICKNKLENREKRKEIKTNIFKQTLIPSTFTTPRNDTADIIQLKNDVKEIKESINKILSLMNSIYEFETSE